MDERTAGRLEMTGARARTLLGPRPSEAGKEEAAESTGDDKGTPGTNDVQLIAARITTESSIDSAAAKIIAEEIVERARTALTKILEDTSDADLTEEDALALESVIHVRGRPALRIFGEHGQRMESLALYPGSELWQEFIAEYEQKIVHAAAMTGAVFVTSFSTGNPPWIQGSAWLVAPNRVVTNRHVLLPDVPGIPLVEHTGNGAEVRLRSGFTIAIDFAHDHRTFTEATRRRVTSILYASKPQDPVDIAVLEIEPNETGKPLVLAPNTAQPPTNLFVVGHPGAMHLVPTAVKMVFGSPDGRKRVSFGKRINVTGRSTDIVHDASTVGGYSGGPVIGISQGSVGAVHYFGDPVSGNLAVTAEAIRTHAAFQHIEATFP